MSCKKNDSNEIPKFKLEDFSETKTLVGKKYFFPQILKPSRILVKNDKLIISDRSGISILHKVDIKSMTYEQEIGRIGWGPGEIPGVWNIDPGVDEDTFWVYSNTGKLFAAYDLNDTTPKQLYTDVVKQAENWYLATSLRKVGHKVFIGRMINGEDQFVVFDSLGQIKQKIGKWGEVMPKLSYDPYLIADLHQGDLVGNAKKGIFVLPSIYVDGIEIIDLNQGTKKTVIGPLDYYPDYKLIKSRGQQEIIPDFNTTILNYNTGFIGEKEIFLAYIGSSREESDGEVDVKNIFVLDFDGKPLRRFILDQAVLNITVDEQQRKIYGTSTDREPGILVFEY